jgi:inosine-uridine nucleoside N-ribohydrolase
VTEPARGREVTLATRIHVDTDPGLDDLLALALAFGSPELRVCGITTVAGNASLEAVTENARRFAALVGAAVPLGRGADAPLALSPVNAVHVHGPDGRRGIPLPEAGPAELPSAREVLRASLAVHGVERVVALGPLTNVGALVREEPTLFERAEIVWMGGSLSGGNATPLAEFNAWADPEALSAVLESGVRFRIVPLDVTSLVRLRARDLARESFGDAPLARLVERLLRALMEIERPFAGEPVALLHDPCAIAAALSPELFRWEERALDVRVEEGRERGRIVADPGASGPGARVAVEARADTIARTVLARVAGFAANFGGSL